MAVCCDANRIFCYGADNEVLKVHPAFVKTLCTSYKNNNTLKFWQRSVLSNGVFNACISTGVLNGPRMTKECTFSSFASQGAIRWFQPHGALGASTPGSLATTWGFSPTTLLQLKPHWRRCWLHGRLALRCAWQRSKSFCSFAALQSFGEHPLSYVDRVACPWEGGRFD